MSKCSNKAAACKVLAVANYKGGVGKTCTAQNLSAALCLQGFKVLAVDIDGQCNLTACFGVIPPEGAPMYHALMRAGAAPVPVPVLQAPEGSGRVDILPACEDLAAINVDLANSSDRAARLGEVLEPFRTQYDYIIIDTPPAIDVLTIGALYSADAVLITLQPQPMALQGLLKIRDRITTIETNRSRPLPFRVLITQFDARKTLHKLILQTVTGAGFGMLPGSVRECVALSEATASGLDVFRYSPRSKGAEDYAEVAQNVIKWRF